MVGGQEGEGARRYVLEIATPQPGRVQGRVWIEGQGPSAPFSGWMGLLRLLESGDWTGPPGLSGAELEEGRVDGR